jgi:pyruvate dehydrogenase (quinone)
MNHTVADFVIARLQQWGVNRLFGYPGDGINGLMGAIARAVPEMEFVRARHEEMSAFMACGHAKFTGEVGVCMATSGPGAIHLLNGLYDAKLDHMPVVAIVGQQARASLGSDFQQEVDLVTLFKDVASAYVETVTSPTQVRHVVDRALRVAIAERTVTAIIIPKDVQEEPAVASPPREHGSTYSGAGAVQPRLYPDELALDRAAQLINAGERVAILAGAGALEATDELVTLAEITGGGIAKALLGKCAAPDDLAFVTGSIGLLGTSASWHLMQACDTLIMVGTTFPYAEFLPPDGQARAVQIDIAPRNVGMRYPTEVNLIGDAGETLRRLLPRLRPRTDRSFRQSIERWVEKSWADIEARSMTEAEPVNPQRVFWELSARLPESVMICGDSGSHTNWFARNLCLRRGMRASLSGKLASMGSALPYAVAAKFAFPDRPTLAIVGDGAMQMNGLSELITVKQYWRRWSHPGFVVAVVNNRDLNQVTWEQRVLNGDPRFDAAQAVEDFSYAGFAEMLGFTGLRVDRPSEIVPAWHLAFTSTRPVVIEFITDPNVPPLPSHVTVDQARNLLRALAAGDSDRVEVIKQSFRQLFPQSVE